MPHPFLSGALSFCLLIADLMSAFPEEQKEIGSLSATSLLLAGFLILQGAV